MKKFDKLVRNRVSGLLESKGYKVTTKKLDGEQREKGLYSLFLREFKECEVELDAKKLQINYADMLEIIQDLSVEDITVADIKHLESQPMKWYKRLMPKKERIKQSKTNLLLKYDELLQIDNDEVRKEQLKEMFAALKELIEARGFNFSKVESLRMERLAKLGGFSQGIYLEEVEKTGKVDYSF